MYCLLSVVLTSYPYSIFYSVSYSLIFLRLRVCSSGLASYIPLPSIPIIVVLILYILWHLLFLKIFWSSLGFLPYLAFIGFYRLYMRSF